MNLAYNVLCAYSPTAPQTGTAPGDAPWLLLTGTARWRGAETQTRVCVCVLVAVC